MIVIYSEKDPAGMNIAQRLQGSGLELLKVKEDITQCDKEIEGVGADKIIFASRHRSERGQACFTAHTPGNWGKAEKGGKDKQLCWATPSIMKSILININLHAEISKLKWNCFFEQDHHGPFIETPCCFIEIGSTEREWKNELAGKVVAEAIMDYIDKPHNWPVAFGVGSGHYAPKFSKYELLETEVANWAFAHGLPKYHIDNIDLELFRQGIERSIEKVEKIFIDKKGATAMQKEKIIEFSKKLSIGYIFV